MMFQYSMLPLSRRELARAMDWREVKYGLTSRDFASGGTSQNLVISASQNLASFVRWRGGRPRLGSRGAEYVFGTLVAVAKRCPGTCISRSFR